MARTALLRYLKIAAVSGSVYQATATAGTTANNATIARYLVGGTTSARRFVPLAASSTDRPVPSTGTAPGNEGWRDNVAENAADQVRYAAGNWSVRIRYRRSGQALEIDQAATITAICYRVTSGGTFVSEIARASAAALTFTTTVQTVTLSVDPGVVTLNAGDRIQVEIYVGTTLAGTAAAPTVATDLWLTIDETDANSGARYALPAYDILYARAIADAGPVTDALTRAVTAARAIANTAPAADALTRVVAFPRAIADAAPVSDALTRAMVQGRAIANTAPSSDVVSRATIVARSLADSAPASDALLRSTIVARSLADSAPASDVLVRTVAFPRAIANAAPASDAVTRSWGGARALADAAPVVDVLVRALTYGRFLDEEIGTTAVDPVRTIGRRISGVIRDAAGTPVVGATVKLFRQTDDRVVRTAVSGAGGAYAFDRDILDVAGRDGLGYYVLSYLAGAPETHGVSDRGLLPVLL